MAKDAISVSAAKKARLAIAILNADVGHPSGTTTELDRLVVGPTEELDQQSAPDTLNRSVIVELISALSCIDSRDISARRRPT